MWDMTPRGVSYRALNSGGSRAAVTSMDSSHYWQEMTGGMFSGENRNQIEHSEPYGMTSAIIPQNSAGVAEAIMNHMNGSRHHAVASVIGDRRYRPLNLTSGETTQHDDIGQHCYLTRNGIMIMSLDGQGGSTQGGGNTQRFVSMRHVQNYLGSSGGGSGTSGAGTSGQHNGNDGQKAQKATVNLEHRVDAKRVHTYNGTTEVKYYDKASQAFWKNGNTIQNIAQQTITNQGGQQVTDQAPTINHDGNTNVSQNLSVGQIITAEAVTTTSDINYKDNVSPARYGLDTVMKSCVVEYDIGGRRAHGLLAQHQQNICPESVVQHTIPAKRSEEGHVTEWKSVLTLDLGFNIGVLFNAVQQQQATIEDLRREIAELKERAA